MEGDGEDDVGLCVFVVASNVVAFRFRLYSPSPFTATSSRRDPRAVIWGAIDTRNTGEDPLATAGARPRCSVGRAFFMDPFRSGVLDARCSREDASGSERRTSIEKEAACAW